MHIFHTSPITVIGMHRSGTTLLTKMLSDCNVWMGRKVDVNQESLFFQNINKNILRSQNEFWFNCPKTLEMISNKNTLTHLTRTYTSYINLRIYLYHFGLKSIIYKLRLYGQNKPFLWGWKDPRTTLLYPLWKQIFPNLRSVAIVRHPREVCISLYYRELQRYENKRRSGKVSSSFHFTLPRNFKIWEMYTNQVLNIQQQYPEDILLVRYEQLKELPTMERIISFLGLNCNANKLTSMIVYHPSRYEPPPGLSDLNKIIANNLLTQKLRYQ